MILLALVGIAIVKITVCGSFFLNLVEWESIYKKWGVISQSSGFEWKRTGMLRNLLDFVNTVLPTHIPEIPLYCKF